jgi:putative phosphonate metabolism protein
VNLSAYPRYALYFVPPAASALHRFGAELLGYDAYAGEEIPQPADLMHLFPDWPALTQEPRTYGFHATLKAPFALTDGMTEAKLITAAERFAASPRSLPRIGLKLATLGHFIALIPDAANAALTKLADDCVTAFDGFRAPLSAHDRERRLAAPLTASQIALLDRWGYPYVFQEFRFHMTLTGRLPADRRSQVLQTLQERLRPLGTIVIDIESIGLLRQASRSERFKVVASYDIATF